MTILTTPVTPESYAPNVVALDPLKIIPNSLLVTATQRVAVVEGDDVFTKVPKLDLTDEVDWVPEGTAIPEADPTPDETVIANGKLGVLVKLSEEQFKQPNVTEIVSQEIGRALATKVNAALLNTPLPTSPAVLPPPGLIVQGTEVVTPVEDDLDLIVDAIAMIQELPGGEATNVIASPSAWAALSKFKTALNSNQSLLDARVEAAERRLLSVPVTIDSAVPTGKIVILDKRRCLSVYSEIRAATTDQAFWTADVIGVKATIRLGATVTNPLAVQVLTIDGAAPDDLGDGEGE